MLNAASVVLRAVCVATDRGLSSTAGAASFSTEYGCAVVDARERTARPLIGRCTADVTGAVEPHRLPVTAELTLSSIFAGCDSMTGAVRRGGLQRGGRSGCDCRKLTLRTGRVLRREKRASGCDHPVTSSADSLCRLSRRSHCHVTVCRPLLPAPISPSLDNVICRVGCPGTSQALSCRRRCLAG